MTTTSLFKEGTIFALASAPGRAGIAVLRVSGPRAREVLEKLCYPPKIPKPRRASRRKIVSQKTEGEVIDDSIIVWFPSPHSYTGEDVVEIYVHGSRAVLAGILEELGGLDGFRLAEPGEFTRRAFENGKLDLTEAEAVADLVNAETIAQRRQAIRQLEGDLGKLYYGWAERLKNCLAYLEADIDFTEDDLPENLVTQQTEEIKSLLEEIKKHLDDKHKGERLREGFLVTILGPPNAGKSSLLNALAQREAAIVTPQPGTTRDVIEVHLDLGGYPVTIADTAGLRDCADVIENEGIHRALDRAEKADLKLLLFDGEKWPLLDEKTRSFEDENSIVVINKVDLIKTRETSGTKELFISAKTGEGLKELVEKLIQKIIDKFPFTGQPSLTRARHRTALEECQKHLCRALEAEEAELRAEDTRLAMRSLGRITGNVGVEDLLDIIFRDFCIGK